MIPRRRGKGHKCFGGHIDALQPERGAHDWGGGNTGKGLVEEGWI